MTAKSGCTRTRGRLPTVTGGWLRVMLLSGLIVCLVGGTAFAQTVRTDKQDYVPGETVVITGRTWLVFSMNGSGKKRDLKIWDSWLVHPMKRFLKNQPLLYLKHVFPGCLYLLLVILLQHLF